MCSKGLNLLVKVNNIDTQSLTIQTQTNTRKSRKETWYVNFTSDVLDR